MLWRRTSLRHSAGPYRDVGAGSRSGRFRARLRVVIGVIAAVIALMTTASGRVGLAQPAHTSPEVRWERLANPGGQGVASLAAAPEWPASGLLLGRRLDVRDAASPMLLSRSRDGGTTWEPLPPPPSQMVEQGAPTQFVIGPAAGDSRELCWQRDSTTMDRQDCDCERTDRQRWLTTA
jgi:hypothetical protein